jgi:hypothetical protein
MRKKRYAVVFAALITGALVFAAAAWAVNASTVDFKLKDSSVPKKDFKKESLTVHTSTETVPPGGFPTPTTNVNLDFDDDIKFTTKGVPKCTEDISTMDTAGAIAACGDSKVGSGTANARVPVTFTNFPAVVTAFNGPKQNGNPTILLHTRVATPVPVTVVITGELQDSPLGGDFGKRLAVWVPPTGTSLTDFRTKVKAGKYVSARCHDSDKTWNVRASFTYQDTTTETQNDTQGCTVA